MKKKNIVALGGLVTLAALALGGYVYQKQSPLPQKDFYKFVNHDWLKKTEIPKDDVEISSFSELQASIDEELVKDLQDIAEGKLTTNQPAMESAAKFYNQLADEKTREKSGMEAGKPYLKDIENLQSLEDLKKVANQRLEMGLVMPFYSTPEGKKV
ncbi:hypothetical protein K6V78_02750 [Streptococcus gallolyticus]|uniref:hypothetical protein n=1 Tax=Streptococcus hepaticus TaxID=3349163 RepID=UPI001C955E34|nr:hypothetical protein [Streptococcus gallolyticus]MBY5040559.1 hypothetical protein [Streptococcus gallolyticus]